MTIKDFYKRFEDGVPFAIINSFWLFTKLISIVVFIFRFLLYTKNCLLNWEFSSLFLCLLWQYIAKWNFLESLMNGGHLPCICKLRKIVHRPLASPHEWIVSVQTFLKIGGRYAVSNNDMDLEPSTHLSSSYQTSLWTRLCIQPNPEHSLFCQFHPFE